MKHPRGRNLIQRLADNSDVLVENFVPGKLAELGLGHEELLRRNPRLVYASITGYGSTGPYAERPGYDVITEAEAGLMHITGERDGEPVKGMRSGWRVERPGHALLDSRRQKQ